MKFFQLSEQTIDPAVLMAELDHPSIGAVVCFEGRVRNHHDGKLVHGLFYQAYAALAETEGDAILHETYQNFSIRGAFCVHRTGALKIGDIAVWVGVSAAHRDEAFAACRYVIDEIKRRIPIWKKEYYAQGESEWLHPQDNSLINPS